MFLEIILTLIPHLFEVAFKAKQEQNSAVFSCLTKSQCIMAEETARSFRIIIPIKPSAGEIPDCRKNFFLTRIAAFLNDTDFFVPLVVLVGNVIFFPPMFIASMLAKYLKFSLSHLVFLLRKKVGHLIK